MLSDILICTINFLCRTDKLIEAAYSRLLCPLTLLPAIMFHKMPESSLRLLQVLHKILDLSSSRLQIPRPHPNNQKNNQHSFNSQGTIERASTKNLTSNTLFCSPITTMSSLSNINHSSTSRTYSTPPNPLTVLATYLWFHIVMLICVGIYVRQIVRWRRLWRPPLMAQAAQWV